MLKKLLFVLALLPSFVFAQTNLSQGGTGWTSSAVGQLLVGTSSVGGTLAWTNVGTTVTLAFPVGTGGSIYAL